MEKQNLFKFFFNYLNYNKYLNLKHFDNYCIYQNHLVNIRSYDHHGTFK
jgi:hypothetical protein